MIASPCIASPQMPLMGFGTFIGIEEDRIIDQIERQRVTEEAVFKALEVGYRHLDCANNYGNQEWIGNALRKAYLPLSEGGLGLRREDIWITAKGGCSQNSLDFTLQQLGTDFVDLYLSHHPEGFSSKESLEKAWSAMNHLADEKKARHIGVSNQYPEHLQRLIDVCTAKQLRMPFALEIEINPRNQENEYIRFCNQHNINVIAYSPLGYNNREQILQDQVITKIADSIINATPAQVVLAWNMSRGVTVIPKSKTEAFIQQNFEATRISLSPSHMESITTMDWQLPLTSTAADSRQAANKITWDSERID